MHRFFSADATASATSEEASSKASKASSQRGCQSKPLCQRGCQSMLVAMLVKLAKLVVSADAKASALCDTSDAFRDE
jgi:hypothetical protein